MVVPRKQKIDLTYLPQNLKFLRTGKGSTLDEMAKELSLKGRTSYLAYEAGKAVPDIFKLMRLAAYFGVSVEELIYKDISAVGSEDKKNSEVEFEVELVPLSAAAGYGKGFGDLGAVNELEKIKIPFKPYGIARAFVIDGDSMEPKIKNGSTVIGIKVSAGEVKKNRPYIIVSADGGVQCKNIEFGEDNTAYLISINENHKMKHMEKNNILELWEVWRTL